MLTIPHRPLYIIKYICCPYRIVSDILYYIYVSGCGIIINPYIMLICLVIAKTKATTHIILYRSS